jgi:hypothetical protein
VGSDDPSRPAAIFEPGQPAPQVSVELVGAATSSGCQSSFARSQICAAGRATSTHCCSRFDDKRRAKESLTGRAAPPSRGAAASALASSPGGSPPPGALSRQPRRPRGWAAGASSSYVRGRRGGAVTSCPSNQAEQFRLGRRLPSLRTARSRCGEAVRRWLIGPRLRRRAAHVPIARRAAAATSRYSAGAAAAGPLLRCARIGRLLARGVNPGEEESGFASTGAPRAATLRRARCSASARRGGSGGGSPASVRRDAGGFGTSGAPP